MKKKNITSEAKEYRELFERREKGEGDNKESYYAFKVFSGEKYHAISDAMHEIKTSEDLIYNQVIACLDWIIDNEKTLEQAQDELYEAVDNEIDVYTGELTAWLADNVNNVYYLTEALEESDTKDGFQALQIAQGKAIAEIWYAVLGLF